MTKSEQHSKRSAITDVVSREYTIHLHNHVSRWGSKRRAPRAIKAIKTFARRYMGTKDVRLDPKLNKAVWGHGIKGVPHRIRVRLSRCRNDQDDAVERLYTQVTHVPVVSFRGLQTVVVED